MLNNFSVIIWFFYIIILLMLLVNIINPRYLWKIFESWKAKSEPTDAYFRMRRFTSVFGLIIIVLIMVGPRIYYLFHK